MCSPVKYRDCVVQWQFSVGPCQGLDMGDDLWMARYLLHRVAEDFGLLVTFDPKPVQVSGIQLRLFETEFFTLNFNSLCQGDLRGTAAHTKFSVSSMRGENGILEIEVSSKQCLSD